MYSTSKPTRCANFPYLLRHETTCFGKFLCPSTGVYSLYTRHWCRQLSSRKDGAAVPSWSCSKAVYKPVWHTPVPSVQWINSWWWAEELPETCRISCRSKFWKLVHLVGFIIKKLVTTHGHMNATYVVYMGSWFSPLTRTVETSDHFSTYSALLDRHLPYRGASFSVPHL